MVVQRCSCCFTRTIFLDVKIFKSSNVLQLIDYSISYGHPLYIAEEKIKLMENSGAKG